MSRAGFGAAIGAAGTTAYLRPDLVLDWARNAATSGATLSHTAMQSKEMAELSRMVGPRAQPEKPTRSIPMVFSSFSAIHLPWLISYLTHSQVEQLAREVRGAKTVTVVHTDRNGYTSTIAFYTALAVGAGTLYLVVIKGWRLRDLGWVTRRAFRQGIDGLSAGLDSLAARLADAKTRLTARIAEVSRKQDEAAASTAAMRAHLADVGQDVEAVRGEVGQVHAAVLDMDATLSDIGVNQRHALHGIFVLCKAVGELAAGSTIPSKAELLEYTQSPVWQRMRPQGLEGILQASNSEDQPWERRRYMLGPDSGAEEPAVNRPEPAFLKMLPRDIDSAAASGRGGFVVPGGSSRSSGAGVQFVNGQQTNYGFSFGRSGSDW